MKNFISHASSDSLPSSHSLSATLPQVAAHSQDGLLPLQWGDEQPAATIGSCFPVWKRILDIVIVLISLPLWIPFMAIGALVVKLASRGPVFFRQERVGLGGKSFMILKFRTMHVNADTLGHENYFQKLVKSDSPMTKLDSVGDKRLIPGGRFLRATALDELPQIFNVLFGEMCLVGPRPCTPAEFAHYEESQKERFHWPPGLTGYWQVNGKNKTTFSEMVDMDIRYGRRMTMWSDVMIMMKTFPVLLGQVFELKKKRLSKAVHQPAQSESIAERY